MLGRWTCGRLGLGGGGTLFGTRVAELLGVVVEVVVVVVVVDL